MLVTITDYLGDFFLILFAISLLYAICSFFTTDQTLYDRELLPTKDPRKVTYYVEPQPESGPTQYKTVFEEPEVYASIVIPAFNEENRLPPMLNDTLRYLNELEASDPSFTWEIIVVDDGSSDHTCDVVLSFARNNPQIRLLRQPFNMGKGCAVQAGALHSRGRVILVAYADGATKIDEFEELDKKIRELQIDNLEAIVIGSRTHIYHNFRTKPNNFIQKILSSIFKILIHISGVRGINDTQCGFKLFSREAARWVFPNQHIERWCFDPELLVIGRKRGMKIAEVPVEWNGMDGSQMKITDLFKMGFDLLKIALFHSTGVWTIKMKADIQDDTVY